MDDKAPAFLVYPKDFWEDEPVKLMTNQEVGCYWRLLCHQWTEGSIPADVNKIAILCHETGSAMALLWTAISPCFDEVPEKPGRLANSRMERERQKMMERRQERAESGARGAKARWDKKDGKSTSDGTANS